MSKPIKVVASATTYRVAFLASTMDAFLQEFQEKALAGDRIGSIIAASRLAALGLTMANEFEANVNAIAMGKEDHDRAIAAGGQAMQILIKNADECRVMIKAALGYLPEEIDAMADTVRAPAKDQN